MQINKHALVFSSALVFLIAPSFAQPAADGGASISTLLARGRVLESNGHHTRAAELFLAALKIEPANLAIQDALCASSEAATKQSSKDPTLRNDFGNALACRGDYAQARQSFMTAMQLSNGHQNEEARRYIARLQLMQASPGRAHSAKAWLTIADEDMILSSSAQPRPTATARASDEELAPFMDDLQRRIKHAWFPAKEDESKKVVVMFTVHKNGIMSDLQLSGSSGSATADEAALKAVNDSAPFRRLPQTAEDSIEIEFTFDNNLITGGGYGAIRRL